MLDEMRVGFGGARQFEIVETQSGHLIRSCAVRIIKLAPALKSMKLLAHHYRHLTVPQSYIHYLKRHAQRALPSKGRGTAPFFLYQTPLNYRRNIDQHSQEKTPTISGVSGGRYHSLRTY